MTEFSPREIVSELDRFIVGQADAKRAVALALRNRWRRKQLDESLREEVTPKNILMIGPTGVGKTEISRRLAKLAQAPFIKVEATKFTEVGYVGRDVEQIIRDLLELAITMVKEERRKDVQTRAEGAAEGRVLDALVGPDAKESTRESFQAKLRSGALDDKEIEIQLSDNSSPMQSMEIPGQPGASMGMLNLGDLLGKGFGGRTRSVKLSVKDAYRPLIDEECDKLIDQDAIIRDAITLTEQEGIVFLDEVDKVASRKEAGGAGISREGVQRDLLPLIEGTSVSTKHGFVKTDYILFIASGAFSVSKPSDLLPELQGRLPIRVELRGLTHEDFKRILIEPEASLIKQYVALIGAEGMTIEFDESSIDAIAEMAVLVNETVENIGARRLHTVLERLLEEISFTASDRSGETFTITGDYVREKVAGYAGNTDLSKYIL